MELRGPGASDEDTQPQCVSRSKLNLRRRIRVQANPAAVPATIKSAVSSCQTMLVDDKPATARRKGDFQRFLDGARLNPICFARWQVASTLLRSRA